MPSLDPKKLMTLIPWRSCQPRTIAGCSGAEPEPIRVRLLTSTVAMSSSLPSSIQSSAGGAHV